MDELLDSNYKDRIEALKDEDDFEALGDAEFLDHADADARLLWAFYRPSGSHPKQVADPDVRVAIMAYNHSRLQPLARLTTVNPEVIGTPALRIKIQNRTRMLFRALADEDLSELILVLRLYPIYIPLACDQIKNGRKYYNKAASFADMTTVMQMVEEKLDDEVLAALLTKIPEPETVEELKKLLAEASAPEVDGRIKAHVAELGRTWLAGADLHPLQKTVVEKGIDALV